MKVAFNSTYGGFTLTEEDSKFLNKLNNVKEGDKYWVDPKYGFVYDIPRHDANLIATIEHFGEKASEKGSVMIEKIEGNRYMIDEYDGCETVIEPKDIEWIVIPDTVEQ